MIVEVGKIVVLVSGVSIKVIVVVVSCIGEVCEVC